MYTTGSEGVDLFYTEMGAGEPLLLLPGASQSHVLFIDNRLAEMFAQSFRVILMDFTGLGKSGRVQDMKPSQWAEDVISVLDALGLPRVHLGGSSLGARVAARVAADSPGRVNTLLIDMPITSVDEEQEQQLNAFFSGYATNSLAPQAQRMHGEQWREAMDFFVAVRQQPQFQAYYSPASYVADIAAPTLICRGDGDHPVHPLSMATDWHQAAKASWLWIEPGASNMALMQACPDRVASTFARFATEMGTHR
jgi:pimeloyl-ACP methyl ester carboxylesterase